MNVIKWLRKILGLTREQQLSSFDVKHYEDFERALSESDVVAYTYDDKYKGGTIIPKGSQFHPVNASNLVSFYRLNRAQRRKLNLKIVEQQLD